MMFLQWGPEANIANAIITDLTLTYIVWIHNKLIGSNPSNTKRNVSSQPSLIYLIILFKRLM